MARLEGTAHTCDRHLDGNVLASERLTFTINGSRYEIDVCPEHAQLFTLNMSAWVRCAHELTAGLAEVPAPTAETRAAVRPSEPLVVLRSVEVVEDEPKVPVPREPVPDVTGIDGDVMREWRFSKRAHDAMRDLRITIPDAWRLLQEPARTERGMYPDTEVWAGDGFDLVVNPRTHMVITATRRARRMSA